MRYADPMFAVNFNLNNAVLFPSFPENWFRRSSNTFLITGGRHWTHSPSSLHLQIHQSVLWISLSSLLRLFAYPGMLPGQRHSINASLSTQRPNAYCYNEPYVRIPLCDASSNYCICLVAERGSPLPLIACCEYQRALWKF